MESSVDFGDTAHYHHQPFAYLVSSTYGMTFWYNLKQPAPNSVPDGEVVKK